MPRPLVALIAFEPASQAVYFLQQCCVYVFLSPYPSCCLLSVPYRREGTPTVSTPTLPKE